MAGHQWPSLTYGKMMCHNTAHDPVDFVFLTIACTRSRFCSVIEAMDSIPSDGLTVDVSGAIDAIL